MQRQAKTIREFCENNRLSKPKYFDLRRKKKGPREMRDGNWVRISPEAEDDWRAERERENTEEIA
jgi:hypothetical protein